LGKIDLGLHCDVFGLLMAAMSDILFLVILSTAFRVSSSTFANRAYKRRVRSQRASKSMANLFENFFLKEDIFGEWLETSNLMVMEIKTWTKASMCMKFVFGSLR